MIDNVFQEVVYYAKTLVTQLAPSGVSNGDI